MLKKTVTYENVDGELITEDLYFNYYKAEIEFMNAETPGGLASRLESIVKAKNTPEVAKIFKELILRAYGRRRADGKGLDKGPEISDEFYNSAAFDVVFADILKDEQSAVEFFKGCLPKDYQERLADELKKNPDLLKGNL